MFTLLPDRFVNLYTKNITDSKCSLYRTIAISYHYRHRFAGILVQLSIDIGCANKIKHA